MSRPPYKVVITTSDNYLKVLRPMIWLMKKYWRPMPDVIVAGFTPPDFELPSCWTFVSIGKQEDYPFKKWSDALIHLLSYKIPDDVFILMLEDMWPVRQVNTDAIAILYDYMLQFEYVARMDLTTDRLYAHGMKDYGYAGYLDLIKSMPGSEYHMSLQPGIWRKKHLLSVLRPNESAQDLELWGTPRLSHNQDVIVLATRNWPYRHIHAIRFLKDQELRTDGIDMEDLKAMRELGLLKPWEG